MQKKIFLQVFLLLVVLIISIIFFRVYFVNKNIENSSNNINIELSCTEEGMGGVASISLRLEKQPIPAGSQNPTKVDIFFQITFRLIKLFRFVNI